MRSIRRPWIAVVGVGALAIIAIVAWRVAATVPADDATGTTSSPSAMALASATLVRGTHIPPATASPTLGPSPTLPPTLTPTPVPTPTPTATPTPLPTPQQSIHPAYPGAVASDGCNKRLQDPGDWSVSVDVGGVERSAVLHMPGHMALFVPRPLVLAFHGTSMDAESMAELSGLSAESDGQGFLAVYPLGVGDPATWNPSEASDGSSDVEFVRALLDKMTADYCIDLARVYAAGFSMGGAMAQLAACRDDRIAAIALVAAAHAATCASSTATTSRSCVSSSADSTFSIDRCRP
ncbi:MAG: PHB depolymerase family esterase [Candidatus Limnocylindrales bacterium]